MSDKAETMECVDCSGRGFRGVLGGLCPTCSGTGVRTTGAVAGVLEPLHGMAFNLEDARGHIARLSEQNAALLQQVDEQQETIAALTTDRDVLRLEVQRLKDLNHESQDLYAAIEAERDSLRENLGLSLRHNGEMASKLAALTAKRDELQLALDTATAKRGFDSDRFKAEAERLTAQAYEANARAESYLRVIEALRYELAGVMHCHAATIRSIVRLANAGLELPEVECP